MIRIIYYVAALLALPFGALAEIQVVGNLARTKSAKPGETWEGVIYLKNTGATPAEVRVRQNDYLFSADGANRYEQPGTTPRSNADWISVTPPRLVLAPRETAQVRYSCKVPNRPELKGAYWSMIMIEPVAAAAIQPRQERSVGLQTMVRFGIQIVTEIGTGSSAIAVRDKRLLSEPDGARKFQIDIENTGERTLLPTISVELYDARGASVGRFDAGKTRIYPTCSIRSTANLTGVPPGKYTALVLIDNGEANVLGAQYSLDIGS